MTEPTTLGISGKIAKAFQSSAITPLLALLALLLGLFAIIVTPKEEEPQIDVTFADVYIPYVGATPEEVSRQVTLPAEKIISELKGIDTLYSFSMNDGALIIAVFDVGVARDHAIVNLYNQLQSNQDKFNQAAGIGTPLIKPRGIDDVPIVGLTLWSKDPNVNAEDLTIVATELENEFKRVKGTREIYSMGRQELAVNVRLDPLKMNHYGVSFSELTHVLTDNNQISMPGDLIQQNQLIKVQTGQFLQSIEDVSQLIVKVSQVNNQANPVYLSDIADISLQADTATDNVWHVDSSGTYPAVTIAIGKQGGENAVDITEQIMTRLAKVDNLLIPDNVEVTVSRNYGETAGNKANTLILKLMFATMAVVLLVLITMGKREALVVGIAIIVTLAMTLFASWAWGFTLNRISLFALIFSIGILVDDAIVVVENIHRHMAMGTKDFKTLIPLAVDEVGGPTILATFTVIAALMPMAFVSGLMGPYMSPIPINSSMGMLISLVVAFVVTPWLSLKLLRHSHSGQQDNSDVTVSSSATSDTKQAVRQTQLNSGQQDNSGVTASSSATPDTKQAVRQTQLKPQSHNTDDKLQALFTRLMTPFLIGSKARLARFGLTGAILLLIAIAVALPVGQAVILKMLPFDNKSEFQVLVDMPEGTPVEQTQRVLKDLSDYLLSVDEVEHLQLYAGTHAPINFNGLVRHYFMRQSQELGDIQVNLVDKSDRSRDSHEIATSVRNKLHEIAKPYQANIKIVEVPPGPPVWSPILAEVYAPTTELREQTAKALEQRFKQTEHVVDVDIYLPSDAAHWRLNIDRSKAQLLGLQYTQVVNTIATAVEGADVSYLHNKDYQLPIPIRLQASEESKLNLQQILSLRLTNAEGTSISLSDLVSIEYGNINTPIIHKNMVPMIMVVADMAGPTDSPLYGMFSMFAGIEDDNDSGVNPYPIKQHLINQPDGLDEVAILWDGEWKITYETFRDMGIAYAIGMIAIYLLVVGHFKSYIVPLVIMAPIPLTIIGVMPGHALLGAHFTAPSMIGMIALAGIIVRNSILLVDFINLETAKGVPLEQAVIQSGAVRAKPIMLTAFAAMIGALFIIDDPIFNGLAISLIFGIFISSILTLVVIPILYYSVMKNKQFIQE
ncbi:multidrug transporter AcrB [Shewanella sp. 10N.286.51.B7]|uniref:efflux RND transporter permease subunit n=1 Tax=Shewanella sp. 10N.286.51.B7 TaxID=1880836 RepID=UPI000CB1ACE6|nr:efflux RND transporter permease subunit [Shewanella sp. 10N.286.51.B7]PMG79200.1 multidrug transporter AcrB [Shewanella sp. 10N.286.51.B7]